MGPQPALAERQVTGARRAIPLYLSAEALAALGVGAHNVALPWLLIERTGDPALTGVVYAVSSIPGAAAALVGGALIDRLGRRGVSIAADLGTAVAVAGLLVVDRFVGLSVGWFLVLGLAAAVCRPPALTARQSLLGDVAAAAGVPLDRLAGRRQACFGAAFLAGPGLGGLLVAARGALEVLLLVAACSLGAAVAVLGIGRLTVPTSTSGAAADAADVGVPSGDSVVRSIARTDEATDPRRTIAALRRDRGVRAVLVLGFGVEFIAAPLAAVVLPAHFERLGHPEQLGATLAAYAIGAIGGALAYPPAVRRGPGVAFAAALASVGVGVGMLVPLGAFWTIASGALLAGSGTGVVLTLLLVHLNLPVHRAVAGRLIGIFNALTLASYPASLGLVTLVLAAGADLRGALVALACATASLIAYAAFAPGVRVVLGAAATATATSAPPTTQRSQS